MINPALFKTPDSAKAVELSLQKRGLDSQKVSEISDLSSQRGSLTVKLEELQKKRNLSSKELGKLKAQGDESGFAEAQKSIQGLGQEIKDAKDLQEGVEKKFLELLQGLPNFLQDDVPEGSDESDNITIRQHGNPEDLSSAVPHFEICDSKNYVDFTRGAKLAGSRFYVYNEHVARLERLLIEWCLSW
jgi:seryl-tRNA synthetase